MHELTVSKKGLGVQWNQLKLINDGKTVIFFQHFFSDGNVPSWARQLETRRMAVEQQHAEALQLIAGALTRIAETLERIERSLHQPPIP